MLFLTIDILPDETQSKLPDESQSKATLPLEHFIQLSPEYSTLERNQLFADIQRAVDRRLGPDTKLLQIYGTYGSPVGSLLLLIHGGVATLQFIGGYSDLRQSVRELTGDIKPIIEKLVKKFNPELNVEVKEKYPLEIGENINTFKKDCYSEIFRVRYPGE